MGKHVRSGILAMLMVVLMALPAFAGTATVTTPLSVAFEAMGTPRNLQITGNPAVTYLSTQDVQVANVIRVNLVNAVFRNLTYYMCDSGGTQIAINTGAGGLSQADFQVVVGVQIGVNEPINITSDPGGCDNSNVFDFTLLTGAGNATIMFTQLGVGLLILDTSNAANLVTVQNQYGAAVGTPSKHFIDVLSGTGVEFTAATGASPAGVLGTPPTILADSRQGSNVATPFSLRITIATLTNPVASFGLTAFAQVTVADPTKFQGVSKVFIADGGTNCDSTASAPAPGNLVQNTSAAGQNSVTLQLPSEANGGFDETTTGVGGVKDFRLCVLANGADFLATRTITASVDIFVQGGVGCCNHSLGLPTGPQPAQIWELNGGDIRISGIRADVVTNNNTLINLNNLGPTDGQIVLLQVFRTQTITNQAAPACTLNLPGITIHGNGGHQITAQEINTLCFAQASDLNQIVYAVRMVLSYAPANLSANAFRQFPVGPIFLELPVLKLGTAYANE